MRKNSDAQKPQKNITLKRWALYAAAMIGILLGELFLPNLVFGWIFVTLFGFTALFMGLRSTEVFRLAITGLMLTLVLVIARSHLAENFALYAFLLLTFGLIVTLKEQYHEARTAPKAEEKPQPTPTAPTAFVSRRERARRKHGAS